MLYRVNVVQCRGTPYAVGVQQAQAFQKTPRGRAFPRRRERRPFAFSFKDARVALETYAPVVWAELHGIADQLEISLERAAGEFSNGRLRYPNRGCSAVVSDGVYGRNYDYSLKRYDRTLVAMQADGAYSSIAFGDRLTGRLDGMNEHGLCVGLHYVNLSIAEPGLSCILIVRIVLDQCATTAEAIALLRRLPHGLGYNYSLLDATGDAAVVEAGPGEVAVRRGEWLACTNHFQSESMAQLNRRAIGRSRKRLPPLEALGQRRLSAETLFRALNDSQSPAFHHNYSKGFGTLHTLVGEPAARRLLVGIGGDATPTILDVRLWAEGNPLSVTAIEGQLGGQTEPFSPGPVTRAGAPSHTTSSSSPRPAIDGQREAPSFRRVDLAQANFVDVTLAGAWFDDVDFSNVEITGNCNLRGMKIKGVLVDDLFAAYRAADADIGAD